MKKTLFIILATASAATALVALANASFLASVPAAIVFAVAVSLAIVGMTISDYTRNVRPLTLKTPIAPVIRPTATSAAARSTAYGMRRRVSAITERSAA